MVERENLHISLSFLGEAGNDEIIDAGNKLDAICQRYKAFLVNASGIMLIPNESYVRVVAVNCISEMLKDLGKDIRNAIGGDAKPPHLTLCRVRSIGDKQRTLESIKRLDSHVGEFQVSSVQLIRSELGPRGPTYTVIHESSLTD